MQFLSIQYIFLNLFILQCPIDMRVQLANNILLMGGVSMTTGIKSRLKSELLHLASTEKYNNIPALRVFKFHTSPSKPNYTAWLGGLYLFS